MLGKLAFSFRGDGLRARSLRGSGLTALSFMGQNGVRLGGNLILTRLLFPEAFGLMALVQVVMAGLNMFSDLGFRASIIKDARGEDPVYLDTAWTLQILRGLLLWLMTWAAAAPVAAFYEAPLLEQMLPVAGLIALIQGFNSTKIASVNRTLSLGRLTAITLISQVVGLIVTVGIALLLESVWALVIGGLAGPALLAVLSHTNLPGIANRLRFEMAAARNLIGFGAFIFLASAAAFLANQGDRAILGKFVPLDVLALYSIAFFLATVPQKLMLQLIDKILFPLYATRPPTQNAANVASLARARAGIISVCLMGAFLLAVIGDRLTVFLYDPRYESAGPLMVLIAVAQMPTLVFANYSTAILAAGNSKGFAVYQILMTLFRTTAMVVGAIYLGVVGVALAPAVAALVFYPISVILVWRYKAWMPLYDAGFLIIATCAAAIALYINWDRLLTLPQLLGG